MSEGAPPSGPITLGLPDYFQFQHAEVVVRLEAPVAELRAHLDRLHHGDKAAEARKKKLGPWLWVTGILTFVGFVILLTLPFAIPFGILAYLYFQNNKKDLEDRKLDTARHLLDALSTEIDPSANQILELDFRMYAKTGGMMEDEKTLYEQPWLRLGLVLKNGSALQVTASTLCKRKSKQKRKYTRQTDKLNEQVALEIRPPKGQAFDPALQDRVARAVQRPLPTARLRRCRLRPKVAELHFLTDLTVRVSPARRRPPWIDKHNLLDPTKVLAVTTIGYRAANGATRPAARAT